MEQSSNIKKRNSGGQTYTFKFPKVITNHYIYRDSVNSYNAWHQSLIVLEETWLMDWQHNQIFAYILATTEVNVNLANAAFRTEKSCFHSSNFVKVLQKG